MEVINPPNSQLIVRSEQPNLSRLESLPSELFSMIIANLDSVFIRQLERVSSRIKKRLQQPHNLDLITKKIVGNLPILSRKADGSFLSAATHLHLEGNSLHIQENNAFISIKLPNPSQKIRPCLSINGRPYFFKELPEDFFTAENNLELLREKIATGEKVARLALRGGPTYFAITAFDQRKGLMAGVTIHDNFPEIKVCDKNIKQLFVLDNDYSPQNKEHLAERKCIALNFNTIKPTDHPSKVEKSQLIQVGNPDIYNFHSLPEKMITHLFTFCDERSLTRLNQVCSSFNRINAAHRFSSTLIGAFTAGKFLTFRDEEILIEQAEFLQKQYKPLPSGLLLKFNDRDALYGHVNYLRSYSMTDGKILKTELVGGQITSLSSSPEYVAVGYENKKTESYIHLHNPSTLEKEYQIILDLNGLDCQFIGSTYFHQNYLIAQGNRNILFIIDLNQLSNKPYTPVFTNLTCHPALDKHLIALSRRGALEVRNIKTNELVVQIPIDSNVNKILFKAGKYLVAQTKEKVHIWHMNNEKFVPSAMTTKAVDAVSSVFNAVRVKLFW